MFSVQISGSDKDNCLDAEEILSLIEN